MATSEPEINKLFRLARKHQASDLYIHVGLAPMMRLRGVTRKTLLRPLSQQDLEHLLLPLLSAEQQQQLDQEEEVAFPYVFEKDNLFRLSVSKKGGQLALSAHWLEMT